MLKFIHSQNIGEFLFYVFFFIIPIVILMLFATNTTTAQSYKTDRLTERLVRAEERQAKALEDILQAIKHTRCRQLIRD
jgi:TRAP-type mannitol/chloroaromatic compound transport system permease small subunit